MITLDQAKGCLPNPQDFRDIVLGDVPYTPDPNCPPYEQGFDLEERYGVLKREHQGTSLSCVGQAWSKHLELLNKIETGKSTDLSARDIYSQIYIPNGGAFIRAGAKLCVNKGICQEELMPSYENGANPDEDYMRNREDSTVETENNALVYKSKNFVYIPTNDQPTDADWEIFRQIIWQYGGFVSGWAGHCVKAIGYGLKNNNRYIKFINSYGPGTDWYSWEGPTDYRYYNCNDYTLYDVTYVVDIPNPPYKINMLRIIGDNRDKRQYVEGKDKKLHWIFGQPGEDSAILQELHDAGVINKNEVDWRDNLNDYTIGSPWVASR